MAPGGHREVTDGGRGAGRAESLRGRAAETAAVQAVLQGAREGRGGGLVLNGQAGIGKTTLLDHAASLASDFSCLRTAGAEFAMSLAFGALHELCAPLRRQLDSGRGPDRDVLRAAFGFGGHAPPSPFQAAGAALALFAETTASRPVVCLVDDAQWLDPESALALAFLARRIEAEQMAVIFAVRERSDRFELARLPHVTLAGLGERDARSLVISAVRGPIDDRICDAIVAEARGNPLALLELPRSIGPVELAGGFGLPQAAPVAEAVEQSFRQRVEALPEASQTLLLVAAAEPLGDPLLLWAAAGQLEITPDAAAPAEEAGLIELGSRVRFRHPLARAAVYRAASASSRRQAHAALADATDKRADPDRRAWHLGQAALRPDETVAAELEQVAARAQARGGVAAAAMFFERSAELTPDASDRAGRALVAARHKYDAGAFDTAQRLLAMVDAGPPDELRAARANVLRAQLRLSSGPAQEALQGLLQAARPLASLDGPGAREILLQVLAAAMFDERFQRGTILPEVAEAVRHARPPTDPRPLDLLLDALATQVLVGPGAAMPDMRHAVSAFARPDRLEAPDLRWLWLACAVASTLWDFRALDALSDGQVRALRQAGLLAALPAALNYRAVAEMLAGDLAYAAALVDEAYSIANATGSPTVTYAELIVSAWRGDERRILELRDAATQAGLGGDASRALTSVEYASAILYNGLGQYERALSAAQEVARRDEPAFRTFLPSELIEAAVRAGQPELARPVFEQLCERTRAVGTDWATGVELRERALLEPGPDAEEMYRRAIESFERCGLVLHLARAHLLYGEWLRRRGRRLDARVELRTAHASLTSIGAVPFAARAAGELRATGERPRKRRPNTVDELTAHELQIARLVATGATSKEVAAELFLSPRTIDAHLRNIFQKLGITSRRELRDGRLATAPRPLGRAGAHG
jgi:DNA-binding CsgD family transcriptional regulator